MRRFAILAAAPLLVATGDDGLSHARFGEKTYVDGPWVTPLALLEDSRCPMEARCVWAGQVRIRVRIALGRKRLVRELTEGKPIRVADGELVLQHVSPPQSTQHQPRRRDYRFGFSFSGGI